MMDFPVFLNKWVIGFKPIRYTPFWFWFRFINHSNWRMDDHQRYWDFWMSINRGYDDMNYKWEFEKVWGKNSKPETIILSQENYDSLIEKLNEPPDPKTVERLTEILRKPAPWDN
jgi:hypothetical protein